MVLGYVRLHGLAFVSRPFAAGWRQTGSVEREPEAAVRRDGAADDAVLAFAFDADVRSDAVGRLRSVGPQIGERPVRVALVDADEALQLDVALELQKIAP